ncbi:hypothetical protein G7K_0718-t1 [Saitoella complicata NRRL Y-17804]|uniref:Uncharacterized protein n=1 Tax=Saitoella complicata (strain BCRC 22490 / CBS 7301 / JCM 7358 / NBRC 10748 / NRRL Y-17804) TaxID=698492 RepID=A0A0E9N9C6_SAICN|nr:hypothetical protein G7K_0718-t1 [Saitoella complicata NRRL Y-17804]
MGKLKAYSISTLRINNGNPYEHRTFALSFHCQSPALRPAHAYLWYLCHLFCNAYTPQFLYTASKMLSPFFSNTVL